MHKTQRKAMVVSSEDHQWVRAFTPGMVVRDVYAVDSASKKEARNGPFWALELKDATGMVSARIWSPLSQQFDDIPTGSLVAVEAKAERYREQMQLSLLDLRILQPEELDLVDTSIFMPASARSPLLMLEELEALAADVLCHEPWLAFIRSVLCDQEVRTRLLKAPAARAIHHARAGGLLEHILSVTRLCLHFSELYPQLDRQTLFAGAVCHDMGKLWELTSGLSVDYTDEGRLAGHIFLGIEYLLPHMEAAKLGSDQKLHLQHLILSHHGQYEYGSPRLPQTAEAIALHYADNMDAKMDQCRTLFADMAPEAGAWSPYQKTLERAVYRAPRTPGTDDITDTTGLPHMPDMPDMPDMPENFLDAPDTFSDDDYPDNMLPPDYNECVFEHLTTDEDINAVLNAGDDTAHFMLDEDRVDEPVDPPFSELFNAPQEEHTETLPQPVSQEPVSQEPATQGKTRVEVRQCSLL